MDPIGILVVLLILSGFFSGAEIALFSLGTERIQALKNRVHGKRQLRRIKRLEILKSDPNRMLVTILIGNNVVNIAAAAIATMVTDNFAQEHGFGDNTSAIIGLTTGVMTFLILMFGEITPKSIAHRHALQFALFAAPILTWLQWMLFPIVVPLAAFVQKFSGEKTVRRGFSEDELKAAIELSEKEGRIQPDEKRFVENVLEFDQHAVRQIMTVRSKIFALPDEMTVHEAIKEIPEVGLSRIPVYHVHRDEILGVLTLHVLARELGKCEKESRQIKDLPLHEPFKIPPTMKIDTLLRQFKARNVHMALVYDGHGGLIGLVTLEDVLEEVFGEIHDEEDTDLYVIKHVGKTRFVCDADVELEHIEEFVSEKLGDNAPGRFPWSITEENETVGDFLLEQFEHFPQVDESIEVINYDTKFHFGIKEAKQDQIKKVEFSITKP